MAVLPSLAHCLIGTAASKLGELFLSEVPLSDCPEPVLSFIDIPLDSIASMANAGPSSANVATVEAPDMTSRD